MEKSKGSPKLISPEESEMTEVTEQQTPPTAAADTDDYLEDLDNKFDEHFWLKVAEKVNDEGITWNRAMDELRVEKLIDKYQDQALLVIIDKWPNQPKFQGKPETIPSLEYLISRLTEIILEKDTEKEYEDFHDEETTAAPTLLHLAAKQNFFHVCKCLNDYYPELKYTKTWDDEKALPVEWALKYRKDDTAAYLISEMRIDRVQKLFLLDEYYNKESENEEQPSVSEKKALVRGDQLTAKFYFGNIISERHPTTNEPLMKKTVLAVLDKLINPRWPYLSVEINIKQHEDVIERALGNLPDDPMNYDFFYHILEADENGRQPKIKDMSDLDEYDKPKLYENPNFNDKSVSCLRLIADSENKEALKHPVVRMLVSKKWKIYYEWFCAKAAVYVLFLTVLSFALLYASTRDDPTEYEGYADYLRAICEICSILLLMYHLLDEIIEITREGKTYFKVWHNYVDLYGIILTLLVLPLRFAKSESQWALASLGYIFNFLRLFKFANVKRTTCLYTTTLVKIIQRDILRFMEVFAVIFLGFCGAMFLVLNINDSRDSLRYSDFAVLMLAGFRALVEQQPLEEEYSKFGWLAIIILLLYMGLVIVVLLNVLIAQLSYTYSEAKKMAKLQFAADTMRIVTRMEYSRFKRWNYRVKMYEDASFVTDVDLAQEILEDTEERHPWETVQERIFDVREIMRNVVRKGKVKDPIENIDEKLTRLTAVVMSPKVWSK